MYSVQVGERLMADGSGCDSTGEVFSARLSILS